MYEENVFIAHIREWDKAEQSVFEHNDGVARLAGILGQEYGLENIARIVGRHHDDGKNTPEFYSYIKDASSGKKVNRSSIIHSTHGALLINKIADEKDLSSKLTAEMARMCIMSHHGLRDCISENGELIFERAATNITDSYETVEDCVKDNYGDDYINNEFLLACEEVKKLRLKINEFIHTSKKQSIEVGSPHFYISMYMRMLTSILIDSDRTDTACFMDNRDLHKLKSLDERKAEWGESLEFFERKLSSFEKNKNPSVLDVYRSEISQMCGIYDNGPNGILRLVVPCGSGKTLSALRYALNNAKSYGKKHILYIAPYNSILEQNAEEIRKYVGDKDLVLEHHSNVIFDDAEGEDEKNYHLLTENWAHSPIIATTAVQFLNTLFSAKTSSVRRMQALGDSIIIIDETQALPVKLLKIFNAAMNFISYFCNSTILLCSATQPLLDKLDSYQILPPQSIIKNEEKYQSNFERMKVEFETEGRGFSFDDVANFAVSKIQTHKSILLIVNTKTSARQVYSKIKDIVGDNSKYQCLHLSTNMCPAHRREILELIRLRLESEDKSEKTICISTSLIEAGVDISFEYVVRSLAGLDSIVQAAGRCNRNLERDRGTLSVIYMRDERVAKTENMERAQNATRDIINNLREYPENYKGGIFSKEAIDEFYTKYYSQLLPEMAYKLRHDPERTMIDLLTGRTIGAKRLKCEHKGILLKQAFKEAGEAFYVIGNQGKTDVIVEYDNNAIDRIDRLRKTKSLAEKRKELRGLQRYVVQLNNNTLEKMKGGIIFEPELGVYILSAKYYDNNLGVVDNEDVLIV